MKKSISPGLLALICGLLGFVLNLLLHRTGTDSRGLLITGHPAGIGLLILCALALLGLLLLARGAKNHPYPALFPASLPAALGCWLGATGVLISAVRELLHQQDTFNILCAVLALAAGVSLVIAGICRLKGKTPSYLLYALLTLYCMFHLICQYRVWSAEAQLLLYLFPLLCSVFLMLTAYQATCLCAGEGSCRWYTFFSSGALFFCCVSLYGNSWPFYLAMALWTFTGQCASHFPKFQDPKEV